MALGFREACKAGISFGKDDMVVPETKEAGRRDPQRVREYEQQYAGRSDHRKREVQQGVDTWSKCTDLVADEMMEEIAAEKKDPNRPRAWRSTRST
jgi:DNA-directed RNA polymerase subunit beta'